MSLGQSFTTVLQEGPDLLAFRKDLSNPMLGGPCLLVYDHIIFRSGEVQSYLQQAAMDVMGNRNLVPTNEY